MTPAAEHTRPAPMARPPVRSCLEAVRCARHRPAVCSWRTRQRPVEPDDAPVAAVGAERPTVTADDPGAACARRRQSDRPRRGIAPDGACGRDESRAEAARRSAPSSAGAKSSRRGSPSRPPPVERPPSGACRRPRGLPPGDAAVQARPLAACRLPTADGPAGDDERHLSPDRPRSTSGAELRERAAADLLVALGELPAEGRRAVAATGRGQVAERRRPSGPGPRRARVARSSAAMRASRSRRSRPLRGRKPSKRPARGGDAAGDEGRQHGRWARDGHDRAARRRPSAPRGPRPGR